MRNRLPAFFCLCLAALALAGCLPKKDRATTADAHNAQNALDWSGLYRGTLPCADCPGIETELTLREDQTYSLKSIYLERPGSAWESQGAFRWEPDGNRITLEGDEQFHYQVGENRLTQLDMEGNPITGPVAGHFILRKEDAAMAKPVPDGEITERYWKLVELNGKPLAPAANEAHIILKAGEDRVVGSGGCNRLMGQYELTAPGRIHFSAMAATRMACLDGMENEQAFLKTLDSADSYTLDGDRLTLDRLTPGDDRTPPLARFEAVYLQ